MKIANLDSIRRLISKDANTKLSNVINSTVVGSDKVIMSPVAERLSANDLILSTYMKFYESLSKDTWPQELLNLEEKQIDKIGPRSIQKPWSERRSATKLSFTPSKATASCTPGKSPVNTRDVNRLRPVSQDSALKKIKKNTSSGLPLMMAKGDALNYTETYEGWWPAMLYTRTQEQGKTRDVWGISLNTIVVEQPFFLPVLDWMKKQPWLAALLGPEAVNDRMDTIIRSAIANGYKIVSTDFMSFDANTKGPARDCAWNDYKSLFQSSYHDRIDEIAYNFSNVGLVTPDGIYEGEHGTPSGSMNTTPIGSLSHANLLTSYGTIELDRSLILIDDCCLTLKDEDDVDNYLSHCETWGYETNRDKTFVSDTCAVFLQHLYHPEITFDGKIKGVYPISRAYNRLCYLERFNEFVKDGLSGKDFFAIRSLSILECTKYHPAFIDFVKFWISLEKYPLLPSDEAISAYIARVERTDGLEGLIKNKAGDDLTGIKQWEVYKLVKSLTQSS